MHSISNLFEFTRPLWPYIIWAIMIGFGTLALLFLACFLWWLVVIWVAPNEKEKKNRLIVTIITLLYLSSVAFAMWGHWP